MHVRMTRYFLSVYDTGAGASGMKTNKQTSPLTKKYKFWVVFHFDFLGLSLFLIFLVVFHFLVIFHLVVL